VEVILIIIYNCLEYCFKETVILNLLENKFLSLINTWLWKSKDEYLQNIILSIVEKIARFEFSIDYLTKSKILDSIRSQIDLQSIEALNIEYIRKSFKIV